MITELEVRSYKSNDAAFVLSNYYINQFIEGKKTVIETVSDIKNNCWDNHSVNIASDTYLFDSIGFENVISQWFEYYDIDENQEWLKQSNLSPSEVNGNIELDLKKSLLEWKTNFLDSKLNEIRL